jgi:flagellar basal body rod protein FlgB
MAADVIAVSYTDAGFIEAPRRTMKEKGLVERTDYLTGNNVDIDRSD